MTGTMFVVPVFYKKDTSANVCIPFSLKKMQHKKTTMEKKHYICYENQTST